MVAGVTRYYVARPDGSVMTDYPYDDAEYARRVAEAFDANRAESVAETGFDRFGGRGAYRVVAVGPSRGGRNRAYLRRQGP